MTPRLPSKVTEHLRLLAVLGPDARKALLARLAAEPLGLYPFSRVSAAVASCAAVADLSAEKLEGIGNALGTVAYALAASTEGIQSSLEKLIEGVASALDSGESEVVREFLAEFARADDLLTSFKATALYDDGERVVLNSRVLVDLRPVFAIEDAGTVSASSLLYRLRVTYRVPNGRDSETIVLALHEQELKELGEAVTRAEKKSEALRKRLIDGPLGKILEDEG